MEAERIVKLENVKKKLKQTSSSRTIKMNLQVSFKLKVKVVKTTEKMRYKYKAAKYKKEELKDISQEMLDKHKITTTRYLPNQLVQDLNTNQFVNDDFGIVTIKTDKMTYKYPYLSVNFEFEFDRKGREWILL